MSSPPEKQPRRRVPRRKAADDPFAGPAALLALAATESRPPSPRVRSALLRRIRASNRPAAAAPPAGWRFESAQAEDGWRGGRIPGVRFKTLSVDAARDVVLLLIEMAPGSRFPDHVHELGGDEGIVLSGDVRTGGRLLRAGDYYQAAEGTVHAGTVSAGGCTALVSLTARAWRQWRANLAAP
jgi:quercetin dioxygenase-like cupin family protein